VLLVSITAIITLPLILIYIHLFGIEVGPLPQPEPEQESDQQSLTLYEWMDSFISQWLIEYNFRDFEYTEVKIDLYPEEAKGRWFVPHTIKCLKLQSNFDLGLHWRVNSEG
jgi:hypothetical protein